MFQAFYWDVPSGGTWYNTVKAKLPELKVSGVGVTALWLPPVSKSDGGGFSMGYNPYDYYDIGQYNQKGTIETRFGSQAELKSLISTAKASPNYMSIIADMVVNHNSGGNSQYNPNVGGNTWTDFNTVASAKFKRSYLDFHPCQADNGWHSSDAGVFGGYPDLCHDKSYVRNEIANWMIWLKNTSNAGFQGWRWDYVKGFSGYWIKQWLANPSIGGFSVGELWDTNMGTLDYWVGEANSSVFDFPLMYTMGDIFNNTGGGGYLPNVVNNNMSYAARNPTRSVTFVGNHDTDPIVNHKILAYAIILTYRGYPCVWYKDYFDFGLKSLGGQWGNGVRQLLWVHEKLGGGSISSEYLKTNDGDLLILGDYGNSTSSPGFIAVHNDNSSAWKGSWVQTGNTYLRNKNLKCYAWYSHVGGQNYQPATKYCDGNGWVEVWAAPRGYAVYAPDGL
jgi:alpha-amylase